MDTATKRRSHASPVSRSTKADRLAADFQAFVGDVEQVLKSASQLPGDGLTAARSKLEEKVAQARAQLTDGVSEAREAGAAYLRERPWTFIGVALLVGAVGGMLLARRG
jgi:ElaB/YqjD/DUF883 family membrane-anchored ribosome-binding protein